MICILVKDNQKKLDIIDKFSTQHRDLSDIFNVFFILPLFTIAIWHHDTYYPSVSLSLSKKRQYRLILIF